MSVRSPLEAHIAALQSQLKSLKDLRVRLLALPESLRPIIAEELRSIASDLAGGAIPPANSDEDDPDEDGPEEDGPTTYDRMRQFYLEHYNAPATAQEVSDGTGASYDAVRALFHKRNRGRFVKGNVPGTWKLADEGLTRGSVTTNSEVG